MFTQTLTAPWTAFTTPGALPTQASANPATGQILATSDTGLFGSAGNIAGVRNSFAIPVGHPFVMASVNLSVSWFTWVWAFWTSYASAEALVTLRLSDSLGGLAEHRFSFARPIAFLASGWSSGDQVSSVALSTFLFRPGAQEGTGIADVFVETWAGVGGIAGAGASARTPVPSIAVTGF